MAPHCLFTPEILAWVGEYLIKIFFLLGYFLAQWWVCSFMSEHVSHEHADLRLIQQYSLAERLKRKLEVLGCGAIAYLVFVTFLVTVLFVENVMEKPVHSGHPFGLLGYYLVQQWWLWQVLNLACDYTEWLSPRWVEQLLKEKHRVQLFLMYLLEMLFLFCVSALPAIVFIWLFW